MKNKKKDYTFEVTLTFTQSLNAPSKEQAIERLKKDFYDEFKIQITDKEIKLKQHK